MAKNIPSVASFRLSPVAGGASVLWLWDMMSASEGVGGGSEAALWIPGLGAAVSIALRLVDSIPAYFARMACLRALRSAMVSSKVFAGSKSSSISISDLAGFVSGSAGFSAEGDGTREEGLGEGERTGELCLLLGVDTLSNAES